MVLFAAVVLVVLLFFVCDMRLRVVRYTLRSPKLVRPTRLVLLSDLHNCRYGRQSGRLIERVRSLEPDVVLLGGDIEDDTHINGNARALVTGLAGEYPCVYVTGNHEMLSGRAGEIKASFAGLGVRVLDGALVRYPELSLAICGTDDPEGSPESFERQLAECKRKLTPGGFTILLVHRPDLVCSLTEGEFDLVLSGHTHGGQWRIPGLLNGLLAPDQGLFPKYAGGKYTLGATALVVSRGLARENVPCPRIFNRPELVCIELEPE